MILTTVVSAVVALLALILAALSCIFVVRIEPLLARSTSHTPSNIPTFHTNLSTLLPILSLLTAEPSGALLVTVVTPAFKPLFLNWLCFLRYRAKWGAEDRVDSDREIYKLLVLTSDEGLAQELSKMGIVVWWRTEKDDAFEEVGVINPLRTLKEDKVYSPGASTRPTLLTDSTGESKIIKWGSISYQSLMLERSIAIAALVGSITELNKAGDHLDKVTRRHNTRRQVRGVLLVDNDSVWLSSPSQFLVPSESMIRSLPSLVYSLDSSPTSLSAWGTKTGTPCACFLYTITSSDIHLTGLWPKEDFNLDASVPAALVWRSIALCHASMLQSSVNLASTSGASLDPLQLRKISGGARAPSFQSNCLGPALYIAAHSTILPTLVPSLSHSDWVRLLQTNTGNILKTLLNRTFTEYSLLEIAKSISANSVSASKASSKIVKHRPNSIYQYVPLRAKTLTLDSFPSGQQYFHENGTNIKGKPVVVHANYILGKEKENSLRRKQLWALTGSQEYGWTCDRSIIVLA